MDIPLYPCVIGQHLSLLYVYLQSVLEWVTLLLELQHFSLLNLGHSSMGIQFPSLSEFSSVDFSFLIYESEAQMLSHS